jgi:anti-sigma regulatory factor (Ser/Thr protein kinase)
MRIRSDSGERRHVFTPTVASAQQKYGFRHEALLYEGDREFLTSATAFVHEAVTANEPTLVVVPGEKLASLQAQFADTEIVRFADMHEVGSNPARIIPAWREFAAQHSGQRLRGIGEPVFPGRSAAELVECQHHESLLNLAFADAAAFWLVCPYDTSALSADVIEEARRSHPFVQARDVRMGSSAYRGLDPVVGPFDDPLPDPPTPTADFAFGPGQLAEVRTFVSRYAISTRLGAERVADLVLAVNELATNSLLYGGSHGTVRAWPDHDGLICEVRDAGMISDPLIGREHPDLAQHGGRGIWMANQLCDLVQLRSSSAGTVVRVHMQPH